MQEWNSSRVRRCLSNGFYVYTWWDLAFAFFCLVLLTTAGSGYLAAFVVYNTVYSVRTPPQSFALDPTVLSTRSVPVELSGEVDSHSLWSA